MFACDFTGFAHWGGWFSGALFFGAGMLVTYFLLRAKKTKPLNSDRIDSMEILKVRLARGDITLKEYSTLKAAL